VRPYINGRGIGRARDLRDHDSMQVVGHDHKCIQLDLLPDVGGSKPLLLRRMSCNAEIRVPAHDVSEEARAVVCHDGDEVSPRLGVVVTLQADGPPV